MLAPKPTPAQSVPKVKQQPTVSQHLKVEVPSAPKPMATRPQVQHQATPPAPQKETVAHAAVAGVLEFLTLGRVKL